MPGSLIDTNVWLAVIFPTHPCHDKARQILQQATPVQPAIFCRSTQQSFLRLASTPVLLKAYGAEGMTNRDALIAMQALQGLPQVAFREEPPGLFLLWCNLATRNSASPKVWMDAYLAAFAKIAGVCLVTLDQDFRNFVPNGVDVVLVGP